MTDIAELVVRLHGKPIGTLHLLPGDRSIFSFHQEYVANPLRDTLSLSLKDPYGGLVTDFNATGPRLLPFFSNLLPEGALRRYLAERAGVKQVREFHLLWALGQDLPGALTISPAEEDAWPSETNQDSAEDLPSRKSELLRFSLAGVQLKFSGTLTTGKNGGLAIPAKGSGGDWIVKLPAERFEGVPENEFSMMTVASRLGINVPEIRLIPIADIEGLPEGLGTLRGNHAFIIKRFDRSAAGTVHIEDFAQIFRVYPEEKYDRASYRNIAEVLAMETNQDDIAEFIRRLVFSTLIGNDDMHLKNWSLHYPDRRSARLAPAYDLLATIAYLPSATAALKYARTKKMAELDNAELSYLADKAKLPERLVLDTAAQTVSDFMDIWRQEKTHLFLSNDSIDAVDNHLSTLRIFYGGK